MTIALIICLPITALVVGFLVLKATQLGLRWQVEVKREQTPTMESVNPIKPVVDAVERKQEIKAMQVQQNVLDEWLNGAPEEER